LLMIMNWRATRTGRGEGGRGREKAATFAGAGDDSRREDDHCRDDDDYYVGEAAREETALWGTQGEGDWRRFEVEETA
jgi:hypothetical protein